MANFYKVEKNVDMPLAGKFGGMMHGMEVGDSVLFPTHDEARGFRNAITAKKMKAKERQVHDGFRVWRTA